MAPPVDSKTISSTLDARAPVTATNVTSLGNNAQGAPVFDVKWAAVDDASGVKSVTIYVAEDGGDFKIWQRQVDATQTQALFTGVAGKKYEFLASAIDFAGNREAASVANAVLPDDGSRQTVLEGLGVNEVLSQTAELPLALPDRSYPANTLFAQAQQQLPGQIVSTQPAELRSVLAPFTLRGLADGFASSDADIGALAMVELPDHSFLVSAGQLRNEVFQYSKQGGHNTTPLFTLNEPVLDMALDAVGQLWVMTGSELLQMDTSSGAVLRRLRGPGQDPLTHALAIRPGSGEIYVSSGNGIEIFYPNETDPAKAWKHFSNQRVGDLAFAPDGRLWAVRWTGTEIAAAQVSPSTEIISFPMSGRFSGRGELEYRLAGIIDSIAFGVSGTELAGLLLASSNLAQRPVLANAPANTPHQAALWMIELNSRNALQVAAGGTRGESVVATSDGRILLAQTARIDEIAPMRAPVVRSVSVPDGALLPLPIGNIGVTFDQAMFLGAVIGDDGSVLNAANYTLTALGRNASRVLTPQSVRWDAASKTAYLNIQNLPAGQYELNISATLRSENQTRLQQGYRSTFTAVLDMSNQVRLEFTNTRANRADGSVSYDVSLTNIGTDDLNGPLMLLLDPGQYFGDSINGANLGTGAQDKLWILDLSTALADAAHGGKLKAGATLTNQTISVIPANRFASQAGMATLVKFKLGHGVYAVPQENLPPELRIAGASSKEADTLAAASVGRAWNAQIQATDKDGTQFFWQVLQAPAGLSLTAPSEITSDAAGYHSVARLSWTPSARDLADSEIVLRVQDSRGGVATKRFIIPVTGGNHAPQVDAVQNMTLAEGETLSLPILAADADGDNFAVSLRNLPAGAVFDASTGMLTWVPGYDQAGTYKDVQVIASDGKASSSAHFNITVRQGFAKPTLAAVATQALREGEKFSLQLAGSMPGGLMQADGTKIVLEYIATRLPDGATLNSETGWLEWTPSYVQHGDYNLPITLNASFTTPDGNTTTTSVTRTVAMQVLNANGAPIFEPAETWNVLEGQAYENQCLRV